MNGSIILAIGIGALLMVFLVHLKVIKIKMKNI